MFWGEPNPSRYCSISCTISSSFPSKEVTFNVRSQCAQFPAIAGHPAFNGPDLNALQCSWRAHWAKTRPPHAHWWAALLGLDPGRCSGLSVTLAPRCPSHQSPLNRYSSEPTLPWVTLPGADCPQQQSSQEQRGSQMPPPRKGGNLYILNLCWCENKIKNVIISKWLSRTYIFSNKTFIWWPQRCYRDQFEWRQ